MTDRTTSGTASDAGELLPKAPMGQVVRLAKYRMGTSGTVRSRGRVARSVARLPADFTPGFLEKADRRSRTVRELLKRKAALIEHLGENATPIRLALVDRFLWLEVLCEHSEQQLAKGQPIDANGYAQQALALNALSRQLWAGSKTRRTDPRFNLAAFGSSTRASTSGAGK